MNAKPLYQTVLPFSLYLLISACNNAPAPAGESVAMNSTVDVVVPPQERPAVNDPHAALRKKPERHRVDPKRDTVLHVGHQKSYIHIPKDAFVFEDGSPVTAPVEIKFVEYRNAAEIVFSSLPMTYTNGGETFRMNSGGMFEINGACDGRTVAIAGDKSLSIDYALGVEFRGSANQM